MKKTPFAFLTALVLSTLAMNSHAQKIPTLLSWYGDAAYLTHHQQATDSLRRARDSIRGYNALHLTDLDWQDIPLQDSAWYDTLALRSGPGTHRNVTLFRIPTGHASFERNVNDTLMLYETPWGIDRVPKTPDADADSVELGGRRCAPAPEPYILRNTVKI